MFGNKTTRKDWRGVDIMLQLLNISKKYFVGDTTVDALKGVGIEFRESEFVSILGPSGCGKTTLLNIIGGLDQYSDGDLIINGRSTKEFRDADWDIYRNCSIGFVFQSYNLISHQTVLANVELAMTLSGVSKSERRRRAIQALEKVGLEDQLHKKPNQMSGGQMQRVAIARALVNNPDIILADEPTGALDTKTSVQIMDILHEIAKEKLVIMVTHNPELANTYATRIIKLQDGSVVEDSMPYHSELKKVKAKVKKKKTSMSFFTAVSLSHNNLMTKKGRTILTAFAGSIGIIGIALILSLSTGARDYIASVERETLSSYPIQIDHTTSDFSSMLAAMTGSNENKIAEGEKEPDKIYSNSIMGNMIDTMYQGITTNNLEKFKKYIEENKSKFDPYVSEIDYTYDTVLNIFKDSPGELYKVNPAQVMQALGMGEGPNMGFSNYNIWIKLSGEENSRKAMYELLDGRYPENYDEVVIVTDENGNISDYTLYSLGIYDNEELMKMLSSMIKGEEIKQHEQTSYSYEELMGLRFRLLLNTDYYEKNSSGLWADQSENASYLENKLEQALQIKVVGIVKCKEDSSSPLVVYGGVGYPGELMEYLITEIGESDIVKEQKSNPDINVFSGLAFGSTEDISGATYETNLKLLGVQELNSPSSILLYPKDFEAKDSIEDLISEYNAGKEKEDQITYTDYIGLMMSSITTIINAITYILIGFVSIALIVSCIMIGIITYISVLERTKEIGILRAIGASKHDISRVFNAETFIIGFVSGVLGIGVTLLIDWPINLVVNSAFEIKQIATLPVSSAVVLILISMGLTIIAGLIPSKMAAKKDPVEALRTE